MQKSFHTICKILLAVVACTAGSTLYAQPVAKTQYVSGNGENIVGECRTIFTLFEQSKIACFEVDDAAFNVAFNDEVSADTYSFYWTSLENKGVSKDDKNTWFKLTSVPGTTYIIPSGTWTNGFGQSDKNGYLYVYSEKSGWLETILISEVKQFAAALSPGTITATDNTVCAGGQPNGITVGATHSGGSGTYTFEWYKNDSKIDGLSDDAITYTPSAKATAGVYKYTRKVIDKQCGGIFSTGTYTLTVVADPTVDITPITSAICYNTDAGTLAANLSSNVDATPYTYTWEKQEEGDASSWTQVLVGAASTYAPGILTTTTAFRVSATGSLDCAAEFSTPATITVNPLPVVTTSDPEEVCFGSDVMLTAPVLAGTTSAMTYTWAVGSSAATTTSSASYTVEKPAVGSTTYSVTVKNSNGCSSASAATATITVNPLPEIITSDPVAVCFGSDVTLTATASAGTTSAMTYTWTVGNNAAETTTVDTYSAKSVAEGSTTYSVTVENSNGCSSALAATATITVNPLPEATVSAATVCYNQPATLSATLGAGTTTAMTYTWDIGDAGSTTSNNSVTSAALMATTTYTVQLKNEHGCVGAVSAPATITVYPLPEATVSAVTVCYNGQAALTATLGAGTTAAMTYTWDIGGAGSTTSNNSVTSAALTATTTYTVQLTTSDGCVGDVSAPATITVRDEFTSGTITSATYTICAGGTPEEIAGTTPASGGDGAITYTWTYLHSGGTSGTITDSNSESYTPLTEITASGTYHFQRWAKEGTCQTDFIVSANTYTLVVLDDPTMNPITVTGPGSATICYNTDAGTLTASLFSDAVGGPYTYTWQKQEEGATSWTDVNNVTGSTYAPVDLTKTTAFQVSATGLLGCAADFSAASTITVYPQFSAGTFKIDAGSTVCVNGQPADITNSDFSSLPSGGSGNYTYEWYRNESPVSTDEYYTPTSETVTGAVTYTRKVTDVCDNGMTAGSYILHVEDNPTVSLTAASTTVCYDTPATIATTAPVNNATTYTWYSSTDGSSWSEVGTTEISTFTTGNLTVKTFYKVEVEINNASCPAVVSDAPATITVYDAFDAGEFLIPTGGTRLNVRPEAITGVSAPSGGGESYTYEWYKNGEADAIDGATEATYWPPDSDVTVVGDVVYTRKVTETICGSTSYTSGSYILKVGAAPTTNIIPADTTVCNEVSFKLTAGTYSSGTYVWTESDDDGATWKEIEGETSVLTVPAKSTGGIYYYKVSITTDAETITSAAPATVTVYEPLHGGAFQIISGTVCTGEVPSTIYADAPTGGSGSYTYQWYKTGLSDQYKIAGAEEATYRPDGNDIYYRTVTDVACTGSAAATTTGYYTLSLGTPTTTNLDPVTLTVCNEEAIIIATDAHAPGTYTWFESTDGSNWGSGIAGQTTNVLNISRSSANTYYYKVVIAGASTCGDIITSTPGTVTVRGAFTAGTLLEYGSVCAGGTPPVIIATALAEGGDGNYTYQWYKDNDPIEGATAATYQPEIFSSATTVAYTRQVKDGTCATDWEWSTNSYTLTVTATAPTVTLQTPTVTACNAASFSVATDSPSTGSVNTYAWEEYVNGAWEAVTGNTHTLTVTGGKGDAGDYYYRAKLNVTDGSCTADIYSDAATVTVRETLNAGVFQVTEGAICLDATPAAITGVSEATGGDGNYTYQWYKDDKPLEVNATAATYQPEIFSSATTAVYTRSVIDGCTASSITIGSYTLTVSENATSTINIVPAVQEVCNSTAFTVTSGEPTGATSYTWEESTDGLHWSDAGTGKTLDISGGKPQAGDYYYKVTVKTSSTCSPVVISTPATVTVREAFNAGVFQIAEGAICPGATPAAITGVSDPTGGGGNYTYQWYKDNDPIKGATAAIYQPETFGSVTKVVYTRGVTDNLCGEVQSGSYTLTVSESSTATINLTPVAQDVCNGAEFTITSGEPADALGYTWYGSSDGSSWTPIGEKTTKTLTLSSETTAGDYYYKVMVQTGSTCSPIVASTPATVTVHPQFSAGAFKSDAGGTVCINGVPNEITDAIQQTPPAGSGNYTYEWFRNGADLVSTSEYFTPAPETATGAATYTRKVTGGACGSDWTAGSYILTVKETPTVTLSATETTICYNGRVTFTASTVTGATYTSYTWESSTDGSVWESAAGSATPNPFNTANLKTTTYYRVTAAVNDVRCPVAVSDAPATITVRDEFKPGAITSETYTICAGGTPVNIASTTAASGGDETITYTWTYSYNNGAAVTITDSDSESYTPLTEAATSGTYHFQRWAKAGACSTTYTAAPEIYTLEVLPAPTVTIMPPTQPICYGATATFTVDVTNGMSGTADTYTWQQKNTNDNDFSNVDEVYVNTFTSGTISEETAFRVILTQPNSGCSSTASTPATITLNMEPLTYTPPANITNKPTDANECSAVLTHGANSIVLQGTYTAACPMDSLYYTITGATTYTSPKTIKIDPVTSYTFNKGVSIVTYTAKTAGTLSTSSSFSIEVVDQQPPVITCASIDVELDEMGQYAIDDLSVLIATASDNCGTTTLVYETTASAKTVSFDCTGMGAASYVVKQIDVRAIDESSNASSTCPATVTVHNNQPPVAICKPADTVYISVNNGLLEASRLAAASSTALCDQQLEYYILDNAVDNNPTNLSTTFACTEGGTTHTVYVGVKNMVNGKMAVCSTEVLVTDTVLTCTPKAIDTLYLKSGCSYTLVPADDGDFIPLSLATPYVGGCQDELKPVAGLWLENDQKFDIYQVPFQSPAFAAGTHEITWTLKDAFGARATCKDVFAVVDTIRPTFTAATWSTDTHSLSSGSCTFPVTLSNPSVNDNCTGVQLRRTDNLGDSPLDLVAGTYLVQYVAEDASGNVSRDTSKLLITIVDENVPVLAAITDTIMQVDNDTECFATVPAGGLRPVISNVCTTGINISYEYAAGTVTGAGTTTAADGLGGATFTVGATAITYTVTAANGKFAQSAFTVTVQDTVKPKITCKTDADAIRDYDNSGTYTVNGDEFDVTVASKCSGQPQLWATIDGGTSTYPTLDGYEFYGAPSFTVEWTATDAVDNTIISTCTFTVTMKDDIEPVFELSSFPDTIRVDTDANACAATVTAAELAATYTDNVTLVASIAVTHKITYKGDETLGTGLLPDTSFPRDTTVVTYTITDAAGNSRDSSFLVIVTDNVSPVFTTCPPNVTGLSINNSQSVDCFTATAATLTAPVYSDNCGTVTTLSWSITGSRGAKDTSGADAINELTSYRFAAGTNTVRYTATDLSGNTATCSFTVEVADKVDPVCSSLSEYTLELQDAPITILSPQWIDNGSADNCGTLTYALLNPTNATFTCADIGKARLVTLVVTDEFGNQNNCAATTITVVDRIAPEVTCEPAVTVYLDANGAASLTAMELETSATDNCAIESALTHTILRIDGTTATTDTTFGCAAVGQTYTLTVRVLDESGNAGTCTSVVTVRDTLLSHLGKIEIPVDPGACVATLSGATLHPERVTGCTEGTCSGALQSSASYQAVTTYEGMVLPAGTHYMVWTLDDGQGTVTVTDTLIVKDTQNPVLTRTTLKNLERNISGCTTTSESWDEPGVYINHATSDTLAKDNCTDPRDLTWHRVDTNQTRVENGSGTLPIGRWKIQYIAEDAEGNETLDTLSFFVIIKNDDIPIITACPGAANGNKDTIFVESGACMATVPDRFTPEITGLCPGADSLSYAYTFNGGSEVKERVGSLEGLNLKVGTYSVTYTASNKFATTPAPVTCDFTLWVRDTLKPTFDCPSTQSRDFEGLAYTVNGDEFDLKNIDDNCGTYSVTNDYNNGATLAGAQFPAGSNYTIKWTVTDIHGNEDSCTFTLTMGDKVKPSVTLNESPTVYLDDNGDGTLTMDAIIIRMSDNATDSAAIDVKVMPNTFTCANIGTAVPATFTATDLAGNDTIKVINVTVLDKMAPQFTLRSPTVYLNAAGAGTLTMDSVIVTLRDNCTTLRSDIDTLLSRVAFTCSDIALSPLTVTFTAGDKNGNTGQEIVYVTVKDTIPPQVTCVDEGNTITRYTRVADCNYEVAGVEFDPMSAVNGCGSYTFSHDYNGGGATLADTLLPAGFHTITWTVANQSGLTATCDVIVDVVDNVPPEITCPSSVAEIVLASGACTTTVPLEALVYSDNCEMDSLSWSIWCVGVLRDSSDGNGAIASIPSDYPFSAGTNVITYTAVDKAGNRNTCSFTVPVKEPDDPICISVSTYTLKLQGPGITTLDPKKIDNGSNDNNCTKIEELRFDLAIGSLDFTCADIGHPRTVELRVFDASGNEGICTTPTTITVIDTIAPEPQCVTDTTLHVGSNGEILLSAAALNISSSDNCTDEGALIYTFRRIVATDTTYTADTTFKCAHIGLNTVTVAVEDAYGNRGICAVNVEVRDTLPPVIQNRGRITVPTTGPTGCEAVLSDTFDPVITPGSSCQTITSKGNIEKGTNTYASMRLAAGTHEITWTATSDKGYTTTVKDTITVVDTLAPVVKKQMNSVNVRAKDDCLSESIVDWPLPKDYTGAGVLVEDNCTPASALTWTRVDANTNIKRGQKVPAGKWKIQYVATDAAGLKSDTVGFVLTVEVLTAPVVTDCHPDNTTLSVDPTSCYATVPDTFEPTITGLNACSNVDSLTYKITGGTFTDEGEGSLVGRELPVGQYSATYTVFNITNSTQFATCAFEIEVLDDIPPVVTCVANTSFAIDKDGNDIVITAEELVVSAIDCTPGAALTYTFDAAGAWLDTTYTRTAAGQNYPHMVYVLDESGNQGTCTVTVTIIDTIPPVIDLQSSVEVYLDVDGNGTLLMDDVIIHMKDNATDSIDIVTTLTPYTFTCSDIGVVSATFTATDAVGKDTTAVITVTVYNTIKPEVTCNPDTTVVINADGDPITLTAESLVTATGSVCSPALTYSFDNLTSEPSKDFTCAALGDELLTIYVTDANQNEASCTITVTVKDTLPPVITKKDPITATTSPATLILDDVLERVTDNCTEEAMITVTFENATLGGDEFTCTDNIGWIYAEDANGKKDSVMFNVVFTGLPPATVTARDTTLHLDANGAATLSAYDIVETVNDGSCTPEDKLRDEAYGLLTLNRTDFTCNDVGADQTVIISAQGSAPTAGTFAFTVTVLDTLPPIITCASDAAKIVDETTCSYKVIGTEFDPTATENCGAYTFTHNYGDGGTTLADTLLPVGTHTVTWMVTDASSNTMTCEVTITVNDKTPPVIDCKTDYIAYLDGDGNVVVDAEALIETATDCASQLTYEFDAYSAETHTYACDDTAGVRTEIIRVTDLSGNSKTCSATFTVRDTLPPVIVLNDPIRLTAQISGTNVTVPPISGDDVLSPATKDNCTDFGELKVVIVPKTYDCTVNTGTVTVTDKQGLSSSATFSVVFDGLPPMSVTVKEVELTLGATSGAATLSAYDVVEGVTDFCADEATILDPANDLLSLSQSDFTCADIGANTHTISVYRDATATTPETFTFNVTVHNPQPTISCTPGFESRIDITDASCDITLTAEAAKEIDKFVIVEGTPCYTLINEWNSSKTLEGATFGIGSHTITWTVTGNNNSPATCSRTLWVHDKHAPEIVCVKDTTLALDINGAASITAKDLIEPMDDNCGGLTYTFSTGESEFHYDCDDTTGVYNLMVKVTDDASKVGDGAVDNSNVCPVTVMVRDTTRPKITLKNATVAVRAHEEITPEQVIAKLVDNCTSEDFMLDTVNHRIRFEPSTTFTCDEGGVVATVYVKDKADNEASATFTLQVNPMRPAYVPLKDTTLYMSLPTCDPDTLPATIGEITSASVTVCGGASVTITYTNTSNRGTEPDSTYYNYDIKRTWTVSVAGAPDSVSHQIISVRDTTPPLITPSSATIDVYIGEDGKWKEPDAVEAQLSIEDCAGTHVSIEFGAEFDCSHVGTSQTVTVIGRDPTGNTSAPVTINVNVLDTLPPIFTVNDPVTLLLDASGAATLTSSLVFTMLDDNCTDSIEIDVKFSREVFSVEDMKQEYIPVWVYVTDKNGQKDSVLVKIEVNDNVSRETTIEKYIQGRDVANVGDTVTFVITVTNTYGSDRNLIIVDSLPDGLTLVENKLPGNAFVDINRKVITINHGFLVEGATVNYTIAAKVEKTGKLTNHAFLYRAEKRLPGKAEATLNASQPELSLTAKVRDGDYTGVSKHIGALPSDTMYNVPGRYRLVVSLKNEGGATVDRIDVQISYEPSAQRFEGSSRGAEVTDNGGVLTWTVYNFDGNFEADLELTFMPLIATVYTFEAGITTELQGDNPDNNVDWVTVNQAIVNVPNVVTSDKPELHIEGLDNPAVDEAYVKTVNIWGNQVYYARYRGSEITNATCWFNGTKLARGTYWYELVIKYQNGTSHTIRDYVEVLK